MTAADRRILVQAHGAARARAHHAEILGDHAGALIAAGDARRILARITQDNEQRADAQAAR